MSKDMGVAATPPGHSDEPASSLAANAGSVPNASWWYSRDEEHYQGPYGTREEAISQGRDDFSDGDQFFVASGRRMKLRVPSFGDWFAEAFDDLNEEYSDPDGYGCSAGWKDDAYKALCDELTAAASRWLGSHGYDEGWALDLGPSELIPATPEFEAWEAEREAERAQAIEARRAATGTGAVHESAVRQDAPQGGPDAS